MLCVCVTRGFINFQPTTTRDGALTVLAPSLFDGEPVHIIFEALNGDGDRGWGYTLTSWCYIAM